MIDMRVVLKHVWVDVVLLRAQHLHWHCKEISLDQRLYLWHQIDYFDTIGIQNDLFVWSLAHCEDHIWLGYLKFYNLILQLTRERREKFEILVRFDDGDCKFMFSAPTFCRTPPTPQTPPQPPCSCHVLISDVFTKTNQLLPKLVHPCSAINDGCHACQKPFCPTFKSLNFLFHVKCP